MEIAIEQTNYISPGLELVAAVDTRAICGGIFGRTYTSRIGVDKKNLFKEFIYVCTQRPEPLLYSILMVQNLRPEGSRNKKVD